MFLCTLSALNFNLGIEVAIKHAESGLETTWGWKTVSWSKVKSSETLIAGYEGYP